MSELYDLLEKYSADERFVTHRELHRIARLAREEIERLRADMQKLLDAAGDANTWLFQGTAWDVDGRARVACALNGVLCEIYAAKAAGGDDE